ncbi:hypothetical protein ACFL5M_00745 [Candidatus Neomarinimicrobiota bacterium]
METLKAVLELLCFSSGPVIAFVALLGLRQLTISKKVARTTSKRESFRLAAEQCARFHEHITPKINELDRILDEKGCDFITKAQVTIHDNGFKIKPHLPSAITQDFISVTSRALEVTNCLEAFALFFTTGVAAEQVGFISVGKTYCDEVELLLPLIALGAEEHEHYEELLRLYFLWNNRRKREGLLLDKVKIEERLKGIGDRVITPVGLDD